MERRNFDDCGGGSTGPEAVEEGRDTGMNSCLVDVSTTHEVTGKNAFTYKSLGSGGDTGKRCQRVTDLQNIQRSSTDTVGEAAEAGQP